MSPQSQKCAFPFSKATPQLNKKKERAFPFPAGPRQKQQKIPAARNLRRMGDLPCGATAKVLGHKSWRYTGIWIKLMRGSKGQGQAELVATENKKPRINGLDQRAYCL
jgi:hypothetical protein